jgi:hypothetical protein
MNKIFYIGYCLFIISTIGFIIAIFNPFWIKKQLASSVFILRGIFEVCELNQEQRICSHIFLYFDSELIKLYRTCNKIYINKIYK